ncbi:hypothetical protein [Clostridium thermopalmarium]|uniref:Uncharacterized protein n=1 Tax=Clostridium thermopalmarium DSM 5974 TaxID=1121340 RepID=A0A2T0APF2_9CLOT|nr:hypothetical protein [Clostridium thermopalmarium]PRR70904.1 hypothetical protein CPAL_19940 [Clostridium thermopalmarium DSM 5974]PVZ28828.1 hypothetical protein LX19_00132 [Clostridium thermopalmarium DSM 5974]
MHCELKDIEIELFDKKQRMGREVKIIRECSENYKVINGIKTFVPCKFRLNEKCLRLKYRIGNK